MSTERHDLFRALEPPRGGAERFAQLLAEADAEAAGVAPAAPRRRFVLAFGAAACAALVLLGAFVWLAPREPTQPRIARSAPSVEVYRAPAFDRLLGRPPPPAELSVQVDDRAASITEIETQNEKVRIFEID